MLVLFRHFLDISDLYSRFWSDNVIEFKKKKRKKKNVQSFVKSEALHLRKVIMADIWSWHCQRTVSAWQLEYTCPICLSFWLSGILYLGPSDLTSTADSVKNKQFLMLLIFCFMEFNSYIFLSLCSNCACSQFCNKTLYYDVFKCREPTFSFCQRQIIWIWLKIA